MNETIAAAAVRAVALLLDPGAPIDERSRLARDMQRVFAEYEEWATARQRDRADEARWLRQQNQL